MGIITKWLSNIISSNYVGIAVSSSSSSIFTTTRRTKTSYAGGGYHSKLIKSGCLCIPHLTNYLLTLYSDFYNITRKLFDEIPNRDVRTWTILISSSSRSGHPNHAFSYFTHMLNEGIVSPNAFTLSTLLNCCCCCCCSSPTFLRIGKSIHCWIIRNRIQPDIPLHNSILHLYSKFNIFHYLNTYFYYIMIHKDSTSWNILISAYLNNINTNNNTIIHQQCLHLFSRLPLKTVSSWNTIIDGLVKRGFMANALEFLYAMVKHGTPFNIFTFSISFVLASKLMSYQLGTQLHAHLLRIGINQDSFVTTSLLDMYCKCGQNMTNASVVFRQLRLRYPNPSPSDLMAQTVGWSTMISGYVQHGMIKDALSCFNSMIHHQLEVDLFTLTTVVAASANAALSELGQQIHARTLKSGHGHDIMLCSSMIDMYAKCGKLDDAWSLFIQTQTRNVVFWSVMISSYGAHGMGREAIELFELMQNEGIRPNEVSFVGLLTACSHAGLVEDGCKYFRMMTDVYGIQPGIEHFACMVDLFGRAGHLKEMKDFVYENGILHLREVWKAYLSSCWLHKNVEMTNWVSKRLVELALPDGDDDPPPYVLISNTYSANHAWDEAARLRGLIEERKVPGQSWI